MCSLVAAVFYHLFYHIKLIRSLSNTCINLDWIFQGKKWLTRGEARSDWAVWATADWYGRLLWVAEGRCCPTDAVVPMICWMGRDLSTGNTLTVFPRCSWGSLRWPVYIRLWIKPYKLCAIGTISQMQTPTFLSMFHDSRCIQSKWFRSRKPHNLCCIPIMECRLSHCEWNIIKKLRYLR